MSLDVDQVRRFDPLQRAQPVRHYDARVAGGMIVSHGRVFDAGATHSLPHMRKLRVRLAQHVRSLREAW